MDPAEALESMQMARHRNINEMIAHGDSRLQQFYKGAVIFITGGSGFLGKQLIEKLLRSCDVKKIFILLRPKKQQSIEERMSKLLKDPVYEYLHKIQPNFIEKIVPIPGDVTEPRLGIRERDWNTISDEVTLIFHGAATINFTEPLKKATLTNVHGTKEMILLAKDCKNLKSFVHISTAYSHAVPDRNAQPVLEQFYDSPIAPEVLLKMIKEIDEPVLDELTPHLIKGWPNTYAFTKAVAEEVVRTMGDDLPICVLRPAIVICAYREPLPGWVDRTCAFGPTGFVLGIGFGILHVLYVDLNINLDLVPVDLVNNAVIVAAQETATRAMQGDTETKIYTVTATKNPLLFGRLVEEIETNGRKYCTNMALWYEFAYFTSNKVFFALLSFFLHFIPGYFIDGLLLLVGKKTILTKIYNKAYKLNTVLGYYMTTTWNFGDSNLRQLYWSLSPADRIIFNCNMDTIDWNLYLLLWCVGCRKYLLKDGLKNTEKGIKKQFWLKILHYITCVIYVYALYKFLSVVIGIFSNIFNFISYSTGVYNSSSNPNLLMYSSPSF